MWRLPCNKGVTAVTWWGVRATWCAITICSSITLCTVGASNSYRMSKYFSMFMVLRLNVDRVGWLLGFNAFMEPRNGIVIVAKLIIIL